MTFIGEKAISGFGEKLTTERKPIVNLNGALPLSNLRDEQQVSGTGTITDADEEFRVRHAANGDFARLASLQRGVYEPGFAAQAGIGIRLSQGSFTGDEVAEWGYFDQQTGSPESVKDGYLFGLDSTGFYVRVVADGVDLEKTYASSFNQTPSDAPTLTNGNIFQIDFTYYGWGIVVFQRVVADATTGRQYPRPLHAFAPGSAASTTNPNLHIGCLVKDGGTATTDFSAYVAGRQFSVVGDTSQLVRTTCAAIGSVAIGTGSFTPIMSFRKKQAFRAIAAQMSRVNIECDTPAYVQVRLNSTLTGASYGAVNDQPAAETAVELDTAATAVNVATGVKLAEFVAPAASGGPPSDRGLPRGVAELFGDMGDEGVITICAKAITTAGNAEWTVGEISEQW